ncbi:MAG: hypothetical protein V3S82_10295 [Dehalococcoidia bacterium]
MSERPKDFLGIHNWDNHQPPEADGGVFIRVYTKLLVLDKFRSLTMAQRGVLTSLWLYRGVTGRNPPRDPEALRRTLGGARDKHLADHIKALLSAPFVYLTSTRRPVQKEKKGVASHDQVRIEQGDRSDPDPEQAQQDLVDLSTSTPTTKDKMVRDWVRRFPMFWRVWPKKVARVQAEAAWRQVGLKYLGTANGKIGPTELAENVEAVLIRRQEDDWSERPKDKLPNPATFLRGEAFDSQSRLEVTT